MTTYTEAIWHIATGCTAVSEACTYCLIKPNITSIMNYDKQFVKGLTPAFQSQNLGLPYEWDTPRVVHTAPYSDIFNVAFSSEQIKSIFKIIEETPQHIYVASTKWPQRASAASNIIGWPTNLWIGTSIELPKYLSRLKDLETIPALIKFIEFQPLMARMELEPATKLGVADFITYSGELTGTVPYDPSWIEPVLLKAAETSIPVLQKTQTNQYPSCSEVELFLQTLSINATRQPTTWTINQL